MNREETRNEILKRAEKAASSREYCSAEIAALIGRWGCSDQESAEWIIKRLRHDRFIDEARYSRAFASDHFRYNQWGRVKIRMSLRQKGISEQDINSGIEVIDEEEYMALIRKLTESQRKRIKAKNQYDLKGRLVRYLLGKGFESDLAYKAVGGETD